MERDPLTEARTHLTDARCADHVLGLLPPGEAAGDLAHAALCPACESRLRAAAAAHDRARARVRSGGPAAIRRLPAWAGGPPLVLAAAAAAIVLVAAPWWVGRLAGRGPDAPWLPAGAGVVQRSSEADPHLAAGLAAYARHDAAEAVRELSLARAQGPAESGRRVFLASALLERGDADRAVILLRSVRIDLDVPEPWRTAGLRTLEVACRRTGRWAEADSIARVLAAARTDGAR